MISKTSNGGSTWIQQYILPDTVLKRLIFTNSMTILCVGNHGKILQTSDGGINWNNKNVGTDCNLLAISFPTEQIGYCGGQNYLFKTTNGGLTFIADEKNNLTQPKEFYLSPNYPNPFNPSTTISYQIPSQQFVTLKVYDVLGKEIATLVNEEKSAGQYKVEFNPGSSIKIPASGIYFYQLKAGDYVETKKMIFMK